MAPLRGVSLIDAVVGSALVLLIFLALIGLMRTTLLVASLAKAKAGATAVANNQMEYIRSLPYNSVGTTHGIPAGVINQYATSTLNGIPYGIRTFIEYVDDPSDGTSTADTNGITTDYKRVKVSVTYLLKQQLREVDMVSNYAPASVETTTNGGTLRIVVVNSSGVGVPGAAVRIVNASTSPTIDVTTFSDASGIVLLGGAATSTQYQVYVTKTGYSSAQTYARDTTNQNPTPGYLTVVKNVTTTSTFAIDLLSALTIRTWYPIAATSTTDTFTNASLLASQTNTQVGSGVLMLSGGGIPGYATSGTASSLTVTPTYLVSWTTASTTLAQPAGTTVLVHVLDGGGALIPDSVLPGNSTGFSAASIDLSGISTTTYPSLALSANLSTTATSTTPTIDLWSINSIVGPTPVPNVSFTLTGAKTVGSTGGGSPIYKTTIATTTSSGGNRTLSVEWDSYSLTLPSYDVIDACSAPPYSLSAGTTADNSLYLGPLTTNAILVSVRDSSGAVVPQATVTVSRTGFSSSATTSSCGTVYFGGLTSASTYTVSVVKAGYTTATYTNVNITGHLFYPTSFP